MTSFVYYKFKSQREESRISFNGTGISVSDLRQEIMIAKGLDKAGDVDIVLLDPSTEEEYDDEKIIPRSSTVFVKRTPGRAGKGGKGRFGSGNGQSGGTPNQQRQSYHMPTGPMSRRFDGKSDVAESKLAPVPNSSIQNDEAAALEAMFAAEQENWNATQAKMAQAQRIHTTSRYGNRRPNSAPGQNTTGGRGADQGSRYHPYSDRSDRPIPAGYVCFRCGQKGHWIQDCPTNNDRGMDGKPRLKRTTGIPRSFLKTVDQPADGAVGAGVMITPEGKLVIAQPDNASWEKQIGKHKLLTEADIREKPVPEPSLACSICSALFRSATRTPCCSTSFCEECIQTHLLENDFSCPKCKSKVASLDKLVMDKPTRTRVMDYIDKAIAEGNAQIENGEASAAAKQSPPQEDISNDAEVSFEKQPGGPAVELISGIGVDTQQQPQYLENQSFAQIQAEIQQLQTMLANPKLPAHIRNSASMQLQQKQLLLNQAQTMSAFLTQAQAALAAEGAMYQAAMQNPQPEMNFGYQQPIFNQGNGWDNQYQQQQAYGQVDQESAYQRQALNPRRRAVKRERPSDFVEVSGQGYM